MKDWSEHPTPAAFDDALHKGFGRAVIWAQRGYADSQQVVEACLNDFRFDRQIEDLRGDWLWQIVRASSATDLVRQPLLDALNTIESTDSPGQLCQLARHFAEDGNEQFRDQLERIVLERPVAEMPWLGDEEFIWLDEEEGFLMAVRRRVAELKTREWDWFDAALIHDASEILGGECVAELLESESALNDGVKEFFDTFSEDDARVGTGPTLKEQVNQFGADDVIAAAEAADKSNFRFGSWGRYANESDLERVFERMLSCGIPKAIIEYLPIFFRRAWPRFDSRLLELCQHEDELIRRRAVAAVAFNRHPEVRSLAIAKLNDPPWQEYAVNMLVNNYQPGDEKDILDSLILRTDIGQLHGSLMSLRKLVEENKDAKCGPAARLIYEHTPCSMCRYGAVELMINRDTLPTHWREECRFDVYSESSSLVEGPVEDT